MKLFYGPGLDIIVAGRAGPGPHNSICGPGPGQVCTTAAGPGRAWASNHVCGPGLGLDFRPVQGPSRLCLPLSRLRVRDLDRIWIASRTPSWNHLLSRSTIMMSGSLACAYYTTYEGQPRMSLCDVLSVFV